MSVYCAVRTKTDIVIRAYYLNAHAMAQAVSDRPLAAETPVRSQASLCVNFRPGRWHWDMFFSQHSGFPCQ